MAYPNDYIASRDLNSHPGAKYIDSGPLDKQAQNNFHGNERAMEQAMTMISDLTTKHLTQIDQNAKQKALSGSYIRRTATLEDELKISLEKLHCERHEKAAMQDTIDQKALQIREQQNENMALNEKCTNLEEKVHEEEQKNLVMQEEIYHLKLELQEGNSHWLKSQKNLESVLEHNDQLKKELDQSQKMFASKIDNILREVVAKKGNIDNLEKENLELKQQSAACEEMLREKQEEITAMQTTIDGLMKEKKDLEQQFAACDEMLREKQEEITAMQTAVISSMKEKKDLEQQFAACEEMLREKQEEITAMQTTIDGLMKVKQDLEQQVKRALDESKISKTNLLKIRDDLYSQVEQQEEQIDLYKTRLNEMSETLVQLHISLLDHEDRVQYDGALRQVFRLMINRTRNLVPQQQLPNENNPPVVAAPRAEENDHFPEAND
ncbi:golgin subfamily A member 6-like protein 22 isoform X2 [Dendronephthya gigantea]|uniref:golgin subfamily A member 6-like protein 22 isoform X2 n=1 Tax=Dendronephthya gigantea TaxID=151771 RepID=UPI00106A2F98|nr:golgin subfamily A member 6-like protein 22 isoform X2 [Dendronephthya gigantea]